MRESHLFFYFATTASNFVLSAHTIGPVAVLYIGQLGILPNIGNASVIFVIKRIHWLS